MSGERLPLGPSEEGGLEELVELVEREAIFLSRMITCCERDSIRACSSRSVLTTHLLAGFENKLGFPDVHKSSQNVDRDEMVRFSQCWTFLLSENVLLVPPQIAGLKENFGERLRPIDDLLHILSLQKAHGGIEIDDKAASILRLDLGLMNQMAEEVEVTIDSDKYMLLSTAVVLVALEKLFAAQRQIWEPVIQGSKKWLKEIIKKADPQIKGKNLIDWVDEWVKQ